MKCKSRNISAENRKINCEDCTSNGNNFPTIQAEVNAECYGLEIQPNASVNIIGRLETKE